MIYEREKREKKKKLSEALGRKLINLEHINLLFIDFLRGIEDWFTAKQMVDTIATLKKRFPFYIPQVRFFK